QVVPAGSTVPVADVVGWIGAEGEAVPGATGSDNKRQEATTSDDKRQEATTGDDKQQEATTGDDKRQATAPVASPSPVVAAVAQQPQSPGRIKASPVARKIAAEKGLDLATIAGSGPEGRIIKRDVESASPAAAAAGVGVQRIVSGGGHTDVPLSQMRKVIAKRLAQSIGPIPTFYLTAEVDMERAAEARDALLQRNPDGKFSFNDVIIRCCAAALRQHPWVNSWWMDTHIRQWNEIHVGVAVAIE